MCIIQVYVLNRFTFLLIILNENSFAFDSRFFCYVRFGYYCEVMVLVMVCRDVFVNIVCMHACLCVRLFIRFFMCV